MNFALSQKGSKLLRPYFIGKQGDVGPGMLFAKPIIGGVVNPHDAPLRGVDPCRQTRRINRNGVAAVQSGLGEYLSCLGVIGRHNELARRRRDVRGTTPPKVPQPSLASMDPLPIVTPLEQRALALYSIDLTT